MNERLPADYDRWRTGDSPYRKRRVIARCPDCGRTWLTTECTERGRSELREPECPDCRGPAMDWEEFVGECDE
jgi:hypothetical protein